VTDEWILKTGDQVIAMYDGKTVGATVLLASPNGRSLMIGWHDDAMLGGHVGMMPVFREDDGRYVSLIEQREIRFIRVVSGEESEAAHYVVCCREGTPSPFADNETGTCAHCGHAIIFRPHVPKRPQKICIQCAAELGGATRQ